jgi:hypothetical protein
MSHTPAQRKGDIGAQNSQHGETMGTDRKTPPLVSTPQQAPLAPAERIEMIAEMNQCLAYCGATLSSSFAGAIPYDDIPIHPLFKWNNWHRKQVPKWKWTKLEPAQTLTS